MYLLLPTVIFTGILVGFVLPFLASEAVGLVSVCVNISGTVVDRDITVLLSTENNTATCEFFFVFKLLSLYE